MQNRFSTPDLSLINPEQAAIFLADIPDPAPVWGYDGERLGHGRVLALDQASG